MLSILITLQIMSLRNLSSVEAKRLEPRLSNQQYGIFPRGGAVDKQFTDVFQIAPQNKLAVNRETPPSASPAFRRRTSHNNHHHHHHPYHPRTTRREGSRTHVSTIARPRASYEAKTDTLRPQPPPESQSSSEPYENLFENLFDRSDDSNSDVDAINGRSFNSRLPYILTRKEYTSPTTSTRSKPASYVPQRQDGDDTTQTTTGNPIIYRYFGRSRARSTRSDSVPFIVLAPSCDHWKIVSKILAARGFNVMVCERTKEQKIKTFGNFKVKGADGQEHQVSEGEALTEAVLDALKWQRAILVGCDEEAVLAMEAALRLAPDRVAGLVLCGDLSSLQTHIEEQVRALDGEEDENVNIDDFLEDYVDCPSSIIWDGDASSWSTSNSEDSSSSVSRAKSGRRNVIIGGGLAPHRRLPEQFAWTLTRFVENRVSLYAQDRGVGDDLSAMEQLERKVDHAMGTKLNNGAWREVLPPRVTKIIDEVFAPGSLLVTGRVIATAIIYLSITKASVFQYHNIKDIRASLLDPNNLRKLLAIPGALLQRRREHPAGRMRPRLQFRRRPLVPKDLSLEKMLPDQIDENDKLQTETFSDAAAEPKKDLVAPGVEEETPLHQEIERKPLHKPDEGTGILPEKKEDPSPSSPEQIIPFPIQQDMYPFLFTPKPLPKTDSDNEAPFLDDNTEKKHMRKFLFFDQIVS